MALGPLVGGFFLLGFFLLGFFLLGFPPADGQGVEAEPVDYGSEIQPIFDASCAGAFCHLGGTFSGVDLRSYESTLASFGRRYGGPVVVAGDSAGSPLWDKVAQESPQFGERMPSGRPALSDEEIRTIARWIDEGARPSARPSLRRGDVDANGRRDLVDVVQLVEMLFRNRPLATCAAVVDVNADEDLNVADPIFLLEFMFRGGSTPPLLSADEEKTCGQTP